MIPKEELKNFYLVQKLTSRQIASKLGCDKKTIIRWLKSYGIEINLEKRKFEIKKKIPLTKEQREIIVGTMLGDGHIAKHGNMSRLMISHCDKQKELTEWKHFKLSPLSLSIKSKADKRTGYIYHDFSTVTHHEIHLYRKIFYEDSRKIIPDKLELMISPLGLAVWLMDDGHLNKNVNIRISTDSFTKDENQELARIFKAVFDVNISVKEYTRREKKYHFLSANKRNSQIISDIVRPYLIPCMSYKIMNCSPTTTCQTPALQGEDIV